MNLSPKVMKDKCQKSYDGVKKENLPRVLMHTPESQDRKQAVHKGVEWPEVVPPDGLTTHLDPRLAPAVNVNRGESN